MTVVARERAHRTLHLPRAKIVVEQFVILGKVAIVAIFHVNRLSQKGRILALLDKERIIGVF